MNSCKVFRSYYLLVGAEFEYRILLMNEFQRFWKNSIFIISNFDYRYKLVSYAFWS